ncbi:hypothetical protein [Alloyangia pacifica]|uniref:hypothetical protein n=1 Tax=Alloyangia pacifica TaxID=311180 RepID=UPI001CFC4BC6|nr:hypothetical protein [Alloyangia pacifica]
MTHADFEARIRRIDPQFAKHGGSEAATSRASTRPLVSGLFGFAWAGVIIAVARNQDSLKSSLLQGSLPSEYHVYVLGAVAALLAVSGVLVMMHLLRAIGGRGTARGNSAGVLTGIAAAVTLSMIPAQTYEAGLGLLNENSRAMLVSASNSVRATSGLEIPGATLVSALAN